MEADSNLRCSHPEVIPCHLGSSVPVTPPSTGSCHVRLSGSAAFLGDH